MAYQTSRNFDSITPTPTPEFWQKEREKAEEIFLWFKNKWESREDYLTDSKALREALDEYEKIQDWTRWSWFWNDFWVIWGESFYYRLRTTVDSEDLQMRAKSNQADEFAKHLQNEILFFELKLARIPEEKQSEFLSDPLLEPYHHYLEIQFNSSKYLLNPEWEKIVNLMSKPSYENRESMTMKFLAESWREIDLPSWKKYASLEELFTYTCNKDKVIRDQAIKWVNEIHSEARKIAENEMNSILEYKKITDDLRWFSSAEEFLTIRDDTTLKTIHTLIESVKDNYDFSRDFYKFKADLFWVKSFSYSEKNLEYDSINKEYTFDEAVELCQKTLWKWDSELLDIFNESLQHWKIDAYPKKGKQWWWFCTDSSKWMPVYILINYTNKLVDVSTLIHESWHYASTTLQQKHQNALNFWWSLSTSETPSTFYECLLEEALEGTLSDEELLIYRLNVLENVIAAVPRQTAEYRFEQDLHKLFREKWYLWADEIGELFVSHMKDYTWDGITYDEFDKNRWISRHHSRLFFYVYSYVSGHLASKMMVKKLKDWSLAIDQVKTFFAAWNSKSPEEIFMDMWIDITKKSTRDESMKELKSYLEETKQLAKKLWKI